MKYLIERKKFGKYDIGDIVIIEYWYNGMLCPVLLKEKRGNRFLVSHNVESSKIKNAPDEVISTTDIIDRFKTK